MKAIETATAQIEHLENTQPDEPTTCPPGIPKETAKKLVARMFCFPSLVSCPSSLLIFIVSEYYDSYQFEGFRIPLDKSFVMAIPDLLEIPHVQLDNTSQIIYYNVLVQGYLLDPEYESEREGIVQHLYRICMTLTESWLGQIKNTPADLITAFFMVGIF